MATLIKPDGSHTEVTPKNGVGFELQELYDLIGNGCSYVEHINLADGSVMLFDEKGKDNDLPRNISAERLLREAGGIPGDTVAGSVLVCQSRNSELT